MPVVPRRYPGDLTRRRIRRSWLTYLAVASIGLALTLLAPSDGLQALGLGMVLPGAGFVHFATGSALQVVSHLSLFVISIAMFGAALLFWFWTGNVVAPIAIWAIAAISAGLMDHGESLDRSWIYVLGVVAVVLVAGRILLSHNARTYEALRVRRERDMGEPRVPASPIDDRTGQREVKELSLQELEELRFALDRALQPVDEWNGFHFGDQWQPSATRYQVNTLGWALALANHNCAPAMRGYLQEAQLNLIEKLKDHRLWSYWWWENLWGNLRMNPDPIPVDNIMYTGYLGMQVGLYQAATGDLRHDATDSFVLEHPSGRRFEYDFPGITEIVRRQYDCDYVLWPCEPNWVYSFCNAIGATHLRSYDTVHGTDHWDRIAADYARSLIEEFTLPSGDYVQLRSRLTGMLITPAGAATANASHVLLLNGVLPERAAAVWEMCRADLHPPAESEMPRRFHNERLVKIDPGTWRRNRAFGYGAVMAAAAEMGDTEIFELAADAFEVDHPMVRKDGVRRHEDCSIWATANILMGRVGAANGARDLITKGAPTTWLEGPLLSDCSYPDVLVAKAVGDGEGLELVLYPGVAPGRYRIELAQLAPGRTYSARGSTRRSFESDATGRASLEIDLGGRTEVLVVPGSP
jgi:hypothetical protein